jgi:AbrB family looped-hinge helix DNA binding protein
MEKIVGKENVEKTILPQKRGQITIPADFRRKLGIDENTPLNIKLLEDGIEIKLAPRVEENQFIHEYDREQVLEFLRMEIVGKRDFERMLKTIRIWPKPSPIPRLFLDTSVLLAASDRNSNTSKLVFEICKYGKAHALLTEVIIRETEQALQKVIGDDTMAKYYALLAELDAEIIPLPRAKVIEMVDQMVKDDRAHVLSSAWAGGANFILSLDQDSFLLPAQRQAALPSMVRTPWEFIQEEVPV